MKRFLEVETESGSVYLFSIEEDQKEGFQDSVEVSRIGKAPLGLLLGRHHVIEDNTWYALEGEFEEPEVGREMHLHLEDTEPITTTLVKRITDKSEQAALERFLDP